ncbi:HAD-IA family hydrolase [Paenibacillus motobuensis]|uniref:Uncharacterized protein n=1 Tax=Paenibacillus motobuensis TaxID=295324 RepID=A0ABP3HS20_9BACL
MNYDLIKEFEDLCCLIEECDVISFDIYDTALLRNVLFPTDIFDIVSLKSNIKDFKKIRTLAEEKARRLTEHEDITLDEIYQIISENLGADVSGNLKRIELEVEEEFTKANEFILSLFNFAKSRQKKIMFLSDMYLPDAFILRILAKNGYNDAFQVFISGQIKKTKCTSGMFKYVSDKMDIGCNGNWLHIGDNINSDYKNAKECGLKAYYYKSIRERSEIKEGKYSIEMSIMKALQINYCQTKNRLGYWQKFGVMFVSSIYFGFTTWLANNLEGEDNVFFLSRDGYLPYKLYKKIIKHKAGLPKPTYLFASRRAYQIPVLSSMNKQDLLDVLTTSNTSLGQQLTLEEIFRNLGLEQAKYFEVIKKNGFENYEEIINSEKKRKKVKRVLELVFNDIESTLGYERNMLKEYLNQQGVFDSHKINIVDVGWRGSTHKAIQEITGIPVEGYYFGTSYNVHDDIKDAVNGYAFNLSKPSTVSKKVMDNVMMFEFIFSASHGTLIGFIEEDQQIKPILKNENSNYSKYLKQIHSTSLDIADQYIEYFEYLQRIKVEDVLSDYFEFIEEKKYKDLIEFSQLSADVGIGDTMAHQDYVSIVSIEEYSKNKLEVLEKANRNLWKGALIVRGSSEEFKKGSFSFKGILFFINNLLPKEKIFKALRNPRKLFHYIIKRIT